MAARLQHPHIVPFLTAGEADGIPYYTMPFIDGETHDAEPDWNGLACDPTYDALRRDARFVTMMAPTGMRLCGG